MKNKFMKSALKCAQQAFDQGEVPIGAVVVLDGKVIARGHNRRTKNQIATAHAEILAINKACKKLNSWRLDNAEIYVTVEPCAMCAGAIANARIKKVYFGAYDNRFGSCKLLNENNFNHVAEYEGGVLEGECSGLLTNFFKALRKNKEQKQKNNNN
jgi:tRNA(adenine34) deaminase